MNSSIGLSHAARISGRLLLLPFSGEYQGDDEDWQEQAITLRRLHSECMRLTVFVSKGFEQERECCE
jgi:hypothetical protein